MPARPPARPPACLPSPSCHRARCVTVDAVHFIMCVVRGGAPFVLLEQSELPSRGEKKEKKKNFEEINKQASKQANTVLELLASTSALLMTWNGSASNKPQRAD